VGIEGSWSIGHDDHLTGKITLCGGWVGVCMGADIAADPGLVGRAKVRPGGRFGVRDLSRGVRRLNQPFG
jgi:hypothetical protein